MSNKTLARSLSALSHPFSIASILLLLLNDHLLRRLWPSWWTGKLGDAAWLFFAPLVLIFLLAALIQPRKLSGERAIPWLAYGLLGVIFTLAKASSGFNTLLTGFGERALHLPIRIVQDPTDLLALPALVFSYYFWQRLRHNGAARSENGWLLALMGAGLTLANIAAPQYGVRALSLQEDQIVACTTFETFVSADGGLTWKLNTVDYGVECSDTWDGTLQVVSDGRTILYRYFAEGKVIESSSDGGVSWQTEVVIQPASQAQQAYYEKGSTASAMYQQGPLDGIFDQATGNLVFAMGFEGVLVRTANGDWKPAAVGAYQPEKLDTPGEVLTLLRGEMLLALGLLFLLISTAGMRWKAKFYTWIPLVLGWLAWLGILLVFSPARYGDYPLPQSMLFTAAGIIILPLSGYFIVLLLSKMGGRFVRVLIPAAAGFVLFLLPFILWALNLIPEYGYAMLAGLLVAGAGIFYAVRNGTRMIAEKPGWK